VTSRALGKLMKKYASASWEDRKSAVEEMGRLGESAAVGTLVSGLADAHPEVRAAAERALPAVGPWALGNAISSAPASTRHIVVKAIGPAITADFARDVLRSLVKDSQLGDYASRQQYTPEGLASINAMSLQMGMIPRGEHIIKALKAATKDPLPAVRQAAGEAAQQFTEVYGLVDAAMGLVAAPEAERLSTLRSLGSPPAPEALLALLKHSQAGLDQFATALQDGDIEALQRSLQGGAKLNVKLKGRSSALHIAARHGHTKVIAFLLGKGLSVDAQDDGWNRPLHLAASCGFPGAAAELLKAGASLTGQTKEGLTPLHAAAQNGHVELVQLLLDAGAKVNALDWQRRTPLALAEAGGHTETAHLLRQHGALLQTPTPASTPDTSGCVMGCAVMLLLVGLPVSFLLWSILR